MADKPGKTKDELLEEAAELDVEGRSSMSKAELEKAVKKSAKAEYPDTPSGRGLAAAAGLDEGEAGEAYQQEKAKVRWGH